MAVQRHGLPWQHEFYHFHLTKRMDFLLGTLSDAFFVATQDDMDDEAEDQGVKRARISHIFGDSDEED